VDGSGGPVRLALSSVASWKLLVLLLSPRLDHQFGLTHRLTVSTATSPDLLSQEISLIKDLLEAEPDAKCRRSTIIGIDGRLTHPCE